MPFVVGQVREWGGTGFGKKFNGDVRDGGGSESKQRRLGMVYAVYQKLTHLHIQYGLKSATDPMPPRCFAASATGAALPKLCLR